MQTLLSVLRTVERRVEEVVPIFLEKMADTAVSKSPVDTGAYVTSWSITTSSGSGRSRTSHNKPSVPNSQEKKNEAFAQLLGDIASIPPTMPNIYIANRAPHAKRVEELYGVMSVVRSVASTHLEDAVEEARQIQ
jgi:hypothetical protein